MYYVYAIGKTEDLIEPFSKCYVGVTIDPERRWKNHTSSKYTVGEFIRTNNLSYEENMFIIYSGTEEKCFEMEEKYRPYPFIGLNEASGGKGGKTVYSEERNEKIREALTGRNMTWGDKVSQTRIDQGTGVGEKNPNAKTWILTSPDNVEYIIEGKLQNFCDERCLLSSALRYYKGKFVPPLTKSVGGYRAKSDDSKQKRINTIGWKLQTKG